jgi:FkbH-like protein
MEDFSNVTAAVKLVIWDLDETFWRGTLSEGGIDPISENIALVRELVDRGIMCSICSKNDLSAARAKLEALGVWESFVFPHIDWTPKGQAIAKIIADMGLRAENVLFLDDNQLNLEEARFFNPLLMVANGNGDLGPLNALPQLIGITAVCSNTNTLNAKRPISRRHSFPMSNFCGHQISAFRW